MRGLHDTISIGTNTAFTKRLELGLRCFARGWHLVHTVFLSARQQRSFSSTAQRRRGFTATVHASWWFGWINRDMRPVREGCCPFLAFHWSSFAGSRLHRILQEPTQLHQDHVIGKGLYDF